MASTRRPERLQQVEDRLASLERLKRKYGPSLDEVIEKGRELARERDLLTEPREGSAGLEICARRGEDSVSRRRPASSPARRRVASKRFCA